MLRFGPLDSFWVSFFLFFTVQIFKFEISLISPKMKMEILSISVEADIKVGNLDVTYYLSNGPRCQVDRDCVQPCKSAATNPSEITGAKCVKFAGNFNNYCCCYKAQTNACCSKKGNWDTCYSSKSPNNA